MRVSLTGDRTVKAGTVVVLVTVTLGERDRTRALDDLVDIGMDLHAAATKGLHVGMMLALHSPQVTVSADDGDPHAELSPDAERGAREAAQAARYRPRDPIHVRKHLRALVADAKATLWVEAQYGPQGQP